MAMKSPVDLEDHHLMMSTLRRPEVNRGVSIVLAVLFVSASLLHLGLLSGLEPTAVAVFFTALVLSSMLSAVPILILWYLHRAERETPSLFAVAFLWGGCIATALSLPFNTAFFNFVDYWVAQRPTIESALGPDASALLAAPISAPFIEEIAKALGVAVIFWLLRPECHTVRDGIVYGGLVGAGFNWFEAPLYIAQGYMEQGFAPYGLELGGRYALFGLGGHAMFTAIFGAFLGLALESKPVWMRILAPIAGLLLAVGAHTLNNVLPLLAALVGTFAGDLPAQRQPVPDVGFLESFWTGSLIQLVLFMPFLVITAVAVWRTAMWERQVIQEELAPEVGRSVTSEEYRDIIQDHPLRTRRIDPWRREASAALVDAQHQLALRKRLVRETGNDPDDDPQARGWRHDIQYLRKLKS